MRWSGKAAGTDVPFITRNRYEHTSELREEKVLYISWLERIRHWALLVLAVYEENVNRIQVCRTNEGRRARFGVSEMVAEQADLFWKSKQSPFPPLCSKTYHSFMCCWISFAFVLLCSILLPSSFPNLFFLFPHIIYFFPLHLKQLHTPFLGPFSLIFLLLFFRTWWHPLILIFTHFRFFSGHLPFHFLSCCLYHDYPVMRGGDVCRELRAGYYVELWVSGSGLLNNEIGWEDQNIPEPLN